MTVIDRSCIVPSCPPGKPTRLYPGGWFCEDHKPGARRAA